MTNSDDCDGRRRVVFLDRDGTLIATAVENGRPRAFTSLSDLRFLDGVHDGCTELRRAGFALVLVTNQPEIGRGTLSASTVDEMNAAVVSELQLDMASTCPHDDRDRCRCRKPLPGMLEAASRRLGVVLDRRSFMVGDRWRDIAAGAAAGVTTVFLDAGYDEPVLIEPDHTAHAFTDAVSWILQQRGVPRHDR